MQGVLQGFVGAMSAGPHHPLWEAGAGVRQLAGSQVTCIGLGDTKRHVSQQDRVPPATSQALQSLSEKS